MPAEKVAHGVGGVSSFGRRKNEDRTDGFSSLPRRQITALAVSAYRERPRGPIRRSRRAPEALRHHVWVEASMNALSKALGGPEVTNPPDGPRR